MLNHRLAPSVRGSEACSRGSRVQAAGNGVHASGLDAPVELRNGRVLSGPDLSVEVNGLRMPNPFVIGSGPPGTNYQVMKKAFEEGWGGVICKTLSLDSKKVVNVTPRYAKLRDSNNKVFGPLGIPLRKFNAAAVAATTPVMVVAVLLEVAVGKAAAKTCSMLWLGDTCTSSTLAAPIVPQHQEMQRLKQEFPDRVLIASIMEEYNKGAWEEIIGRCEEVGVDAFELNFSCPHGMPERKMGMAMGQDCDLMSEVCGWINAAATRPVWAKMTPNITDITQPAAAALAQGCEGVAAINTIQSVMGVNLDTLRPEPAVEGYSTPGGYSYKAVKPIALAKVMSIARMIQTQYPGQGRSLSGIGGVETGGDAAEFILLGSDTVQQFMNKHGFQSISEFKGAALPYFTTHTELVAKQRAAVAAKKQAAAVGLKNDSEWTGDQFVANAEAMVVNGRKWVSRQHYHQERGEAVFLGAGNFSQGGWKAKAVRDGFRKVVEQPSRPSTDPRPDRLVIVDESSTSRVSSSVHARQPCELHLPDDRPRPEDCVPPAGQVNQRLLRPAWSLRHFKDVRGLKWCREVPPYPPPPAPPQHPPAPDPPPPAQHPPAQDPPAPAQDPPAPPPAQEPPPPAQDQPPAQAPPGPVPRPRAPSWGRWLDRDTNACLNFQRIGESMQRPLELCSYEGLKTLPPIGKEYQQGYKRVNDRLPKIRQRLHRAAEYRRGIDGRARNNADFPSSAACLYDTTTGQAIHAMDTVALQELQPAGHVIMHITDACALKANHLQAAVNEGLLPRRSKLVHHHARLGTRAAEVCAARAAIELDVQTLLRELMEQLHSAEALKLSQLASAQAEVLRELDSIDGLVAAVTAAAAALGGPSAFLDAAQPLAVECERLAAKV
ncbi:hypothetical protein QJQ45_005155 [Haematococcus lacustris]|nr:hypothetical protein QJQ45_005155 [Haematococcus lacustris]